MGSILNKLDIAFNLNCYNIGNTFCIYLDNGGIVEGTIETITIYSFNSNLSDTIVTLSFEEFPNSHISIKGNSEVKLVRKPDAFI